MTQLHNCNGYDEASKGNRFVYLILSSLLCFKILFFLQSTNFKHFFTEWTDAQIIDYDDDNECLTYVSGKLYSIGFHR